MSDDNNIEEEAGDYPIIVPPARVSNKPLNRMTRERRLEEDLIAKRREQVIRYISRGYTTEQIAKIYQVNPKTIQRDIQFIREKSREVMQQYLTASIPFEMVKFLQRQNDISNDAWEQMRIAKNNNDTDNHYRYAKLASDVASTIIDQVTNNKALVFEAQKAGAFNPVEEEEHDLKPIMLKGKTTTNYNKKKPRQQKEEDEQAVF